MGQWCPSNTWGNPAPQRDSTTVSAEGQKTSLLSNKANTKRRQLSLTLKTPALQRTGSAAARLRRSARNCTPAQTVRHKHTKTTDKPKHRRLKNTEKCMRYQPDTIHYNLARWQRVTGRRACNRFRHYFLVSFQPWSESVIFFLRFGSPVFNVNDLRLRLYNKERKQHAGWTIAQKVLALSCRMARQKPFPKQNPENTKTLNKGTREHKTTKALEKKKNRGEHKNFDPRSGTRLRANFCPMSKVLENRLVASKLAKSEAPSPLFWCEENKRAKLKQNFQTFRTLAGSNNELMTCCFMIRRKQHILQSASRFSGR